MDKMDMVLDLMMWMREYFGFPTEADKNFWTLWDYIYSTTGEPLFGFSVSVSDKYSQIYWDMEYLAGYWELSF